MTQKEISCWQGCYQPLIKWQTIALVLLFSILVVLYIPYRKSFLSQGLWNTLDPIAGISAFVLSMIILYNQAYAKWKECLEKRLTVYFVNSQNNQKIAVVEQAYLSGQSDIRPWAQQLGRQILGEMELDMNWDDTPPKIISESHGGKTALFLVYEIIVFIHYEKDKLTTECIDKFVKRTFKHSTVQGDAESLPVRWIANNTKTD